MAKMKPMDMGRPKPKPPARKPVAKKPKPAPARRDPFAGLDELMAHDRNRRKTMSGR
jgi:hypothetical protein